MPSHHSLADVAGLIGEPTRAAMLLALLGGRERPAGELAREAGLSAAATSLHLAKLVAAGLLSVRAHGRFRFYRLARPEVAQALEALGVIASTPPPARALTRAAAAIRHARRCYDHLAGVVSIAVVDMLERERLVRDGGDDAIWEVTPRGRTFFAEAAEIDVASLAGARRPLARRCLDWTERRPHLAGALGAAVLDRLLARRWLAGAGEGRGLRVTARGERELERWGVRTRPAAAG
jgi:DNA-binding transcriptional ArsR family regulator